MAAMDRYTLYLGDAAAVLRTLPDNSVHCVVTSPPYYGLRDYGVRGQIGLEPTPASYVARMMEVFGEVWRVLRDDGVVWLNLGDSYLTAKGTCRNPGGGANSLQQTAKANGQYKTWRPNKSDADAMGLKSKDLLGIPWRVAFALQDAGWWLRQDIIWHKPNPMPESVQDRCTKAHEYVFLLTKSARYYYDAQAIAEPTEQPERIGKIEHTFSTSNGDSTLRHDIGRSVMRTATRNKRSVWTITTKPYAGAHFATMPPELAETCILAGCPAQVCAQCGAPWVRVVEKPDMADRPERSENAKTKAIDGKWTGASSAGQAYQDWRNANPNVTLGFRPTCTCDAGTIPGTVLDPFAGSGTTLAVAVANGRRAIGIELNEAYAGLVHERMAAVKLPLFVTGAPEMDMAAD